MRDEKTHYDFGNLLLTDKEISKELFSDVDITSEEVKSLILKMLLKIVDIEKKDADMIEPSAVIPELTAEKVKQYLEFRADCVLRDLKCEAYFNSENPFSSLSSLNFKHIDNIMEKESTNYVLQSSTEAVNPVKVEDIDIREPDEDSQKTYHMILENMNAGKNL